MLLNKAAFLDPRFKALPFLSDEDRQMIGSSVEAEVVKLALISSTNTTGAPTNPKEADDSDQLSLSKRCHVSKAEKRLLHFVDDIVKINKLTNVQLRRLEQKRGDILMKRHHQKGGV